MNGVNLSGMSPYGLVGRLGAAAAQIADTSATLTQQATDGLVSDQIGLLGASTGTVLNLQPQLAQLSAFAANGAVANTRLSVAAQSLSQLSGVAQDIATNLLSLRGDGGSSAQALLAGMVSSAKSALGEVGSLLNTQVAGSYVFGGGDGGSPPVTDPNDMTGNAAYAATTTAIAGLESNGADATLQTILAAASGNTTNATAFAAALAMSPQLVMVGADTSVATSIPIVSTTNPSSSTSTGSSVRDLVAVLSTVANLDPNDLAGANIDDFLSGLSSVAASAQRGLTQQEAAVGASQDTVTSTLDAATSASTLLSTQMGDLTSVDAARVSTELSASNEQLQASYMLLADLKGLDLADYL